MILTLQGNYMYENFNPIDSTLYTVLRTGFGAVPDPFEINRTNKYEYCNVHYVYDGCGMLCVNNKSYLLNKGDVFVLTAGVAHRYYALPKSNFSLQWIEFCGSNCNQILNMFISKGLYVIKNEGFEIASHIYTIQNQLMSSSFNPYDMSAKVYELMMLLIKSSKKSCETNLPPSIKNALEYMNQNYCEKINLHHLANNYLVSHSYFVRQFKKYIGITPNKYLNLKRIEKACYLLQTTELSGDEIASKIGMYDNAYFHKCFKAVTNTSPSAYRQINSDYNKK